MKPQKRLVLEPLDTSSHSEREKTILLSLLGMVVTISFGGCYGASEGSASLPPPVTVLWHGGQGPGTSFWKQKQEKQGLSTSVPISVPNHWKCFVSLSDIFFQVSLINEMFTVTFVFITLHPYKMSKNKSVDMFRYTNFHLT